MIVSFFESTIFSPIQKAQEHSFVRRNAVFTGHIAMYRWWHFLAESAARALPFPKSQRPTCPFSFTPGGTPPARPSAASAFARCEPFLANPLLPGPSTCPAWPSAVSVSARCEPFSANRLTPASCGSGSWPGAMAAGAREQAASCEAFVLSRRLPAPDAPPIRSSPARLVAKPSPNHGLLSLAGTAAANSVMLGQGPQRQTAFWPWLA